VRGEKYCDVCSDKDNLHQIIRDVVARRRAKLTATNDSGESDSTQNINDMIDAALMLNLPEETVIADLLSFFIGGFHTSASCKSTFKTLKPVS